MWWQRAGAEAFEADAAAEAGPVFESGHPVVGAVAVRAPPPPPPPPRAGGGAGGGGVVAGSVQAAVGLEVGVYVVGDGEGRAGPHAGQYAHAYVVLE